MPRSRAQVIASVTATFPSAGATTILAILDEYGVEPRERERDRVQLAKKRRTMREMLAKLGLEPPSGLEDA